MTSNTDKQDVSDVVERERSARGRSKTALLGLWLVIVGVVGFLLWGLFAPLDQGVPATGFVKVDGNVKAVQHLRGGIVDEILVREGDLVKEGQALVRLNPVQTAAQLTGLELQLVSVTATESRLLAERSGASDVVFPAWLGQKTDDVRAREAMAAELQLFRTRRASLERDEAIMRETIGGAEAQIKGLTAQEAAKTQQLALYSVELESVRPLYEQGFVPRTRVFDLERTVAMLTGQRSEDRGNIERLTKQIGEMRLRILQSKETYRKEAETQLTDVQARGADYRERLTALKDELERVVLRAPSAGVVMGVTVSSAGAVIAPGQKLMDIVPGNENLVVEAQIPTQLIDNVHLGMDAYIYFNALDQTIVRAVPGKLTYVSADRVTDPKNGLSYYVARVAPTADGLKLLGRSHVLAGMPADVVIRLGERSFFAYLFKPFMKRMQSAFTER